MPFCAARCATRCGTCPAAVLPCWFITVILSSVFLSGRVADVDRQGRGKAGALPGADLGGAGTIDGPPRHGTGPSGPVTTDGAPPPRRSGSARPDRDPDPRSAPVPPA